MRRAYSYSTAESWRWSRGLGWAATLLSLGMFAISAPSAFGQLGGVQIGGGGQGGGRSSGGGGVRVRGGGNADAGVRSSTRAATRAAPNVGATVNQGASGSARGNVRVAPNTNANPRANAGAAVSGATGGTVRTNPTVKGSGRANVSGAVEGAVDGAARTAQRTRADVRVPGTGTKVRTDVDAATKNGVTGKTGVTGDARRAAGKAGAEGRVDVDGDARAGGRRIDADADGRGRVDIDGDARAAGRRIDADADGRGRAGVDADVRNRDGRLDATVRGQGGGQFETNWRRFSPQELTRIRTRLNAALGTDLDTNREMRDWIQNNPRRAAYWAGWGNGVRGNFYAGRNPYFGGRGFYNQNFWSGNNLARNLIGLGLSASGYGGAGAGVGGHPMWWGYSPWTGNRPWNYWWGTPTWNGITGWFPNYGWSHPYYYDYGVGGNVVYQGNQVLVNGQVVGTPSDYAETAAELAAIDPATISATAPEDWMPLGTFSLSFNQDEENPDRVAQLAINKQGLISGTVYNRKSGNVYTLQGRVDKETQRVAFTIGDNTDTILETGLFNLTQEQTPVLVHHGPTKTSTYLLARLPKPEAEAEVRAAGNVTAEPEIAR